jgi:hypothetical protein
MLQLVMLQPEKLQVVDYMNITLQVVMLQLVMLQLVMLHAENLQVVDYKL